MGSKVKGSFSLFETKSTVTLPNAFANVPSHAGSDAGQEGRAVHHHGTAKHPGVALGAAAVLQSAEHTRLHPAGPCVDIRGLHWEGAQQEGEAATDTRW